MGGNGGPAQKCLEQGCMRGQPLVADGGQQGQMSIVADAMEPSEKAQQEIAPLETVIVSSLVSEIQILLYLIAHGSIQNEPPSGKART